MLRRRSCETILRDPLVIDNTRNHEIRLGLDSLLQLALGHPAIHHHWQWRDHFPSHRCHSFFVSYRHSRPRRIRLSTKSVFSFYSIDYFVRFGHFLKFLRCFSILLIRCVGMVLFGKLKSNRKDFSHLERIDWKGRTNIVIGFLDFSSIRRSRDSQNIVVIPLISSRRCSKWSSRQLEMLNW